MHKLVKGRYYFNKIDGYNQDKLVSNTTGLVSTSDLREAQQMAQAFARTLPANRYEVRQARNSRALGPTIDNATGAHFGGSGAIDR